MEITMKKYTPMDYDFVYQLKKICYYPYVSEIWGWDEEKQTDYFNAFMENAKENMNIIYSRGKRIGMINWSVDGDTCELENICILPEYRNQGIGSRLLAQLKAADFPKSGFRHLKRILLSIYIIGWVFLLLKKRKIITGCFWKNELLTA